MFQIGLILGWFKARSAIILVARERVSPMNQEHFGGKSSEKDRFLGRGVAAADHANRHISIKRAVTSSAGGHPVPFESALLLEAEPLRGSSAGDDHRLGLDRLAIDVETIVAVHRLEFAAPLHT